VRRSMAQGLRAGPWMAAIRRRPSWWSWLTAVYAPPMLSACMLGRDEAVGTIEIAVAPIRRPRPRLGLGLRREPISIPRPMIPEGRPWRIGPSLRGVASGPFGQGIGLTVLVRYIRIQCKARRLALDVGYLCLRRRCWAAGEDQRADGVGDVRQTLPACIGAGSGLVVEGLECGLCRGARGDAVPARHGVRGRYGRRRRRPRLSGSARPPAPAWPGTRRPRAARNQSARSKARDESRPSTACVSTGC
jgi:hypothetical protein